MIPFIQPTKTLLITTLFAVVLFSCTKEPEQKPVYFNAAFKSAFNYQIGSYWVFYDSVNSRSDSLSVISNKYYKPFYVAGTREEVVNVSMKFFNATSASSTIGLQFQLAAPFSCGMFFAYIHPDSGINSQYPTDLINGMPFNTGKKSIAVGDFIGFYESSFIGNMKINGVTYSNVYRTEYNNTHLSAVDVFYFNADYGFLKISFHNQYVNKELYLIRSEARR
jgi:hypothetical protein